MRLHVPCHDRVEPRAGRSVGRNIPFGSEPQVKDRKEGRLFQFRDVAIL